MGVFPKLVLIPAVEPGSRQSGLMLSKWRRLSISGARTQLTVSPPSTISSVPVMYFASSDARNRAAYATSQASPHSPHWTLLVTPADHLFGAAVISGNDIGGVDH